MVDMRDATIVPKREVADAPFVMIGMARLKTVFEDSG